jgi:hypothetical protein
VRPGPSIVATSTALEVTTRVAVIRLSLVAGPVLFNLAALPSRLSILIGSSQRQLDVVDSVGLFGLWTVATALVYRCPGVACWLFALAGGVGLYDGITNGIDEITLWGWAAVGFTGLPSFAHREKRAANQREGARTQPELAAHAALRGLHETVPELLTHVSLSDERDARLSGIVELRP